MRTALCYLLALLDSASFSTLFLPGVGRKIYCSLDPWASILSVLGVQRSCPALRLQQSCPGYLVSDQEKGYRYYQGIGYRYYQGIGFRTQDYSRPYYYHGRGCCLAQESWEWAFPQTDRNLKKEKG